MNRIKDLRMRSGYTQEDLARIMDVSHVSVHGWEAGRNDPTWQNILKLSEIFAVSIIYLMGVDDKGEE